MIIFLILVIILVLIFFFSKSEYVTEQSDSGRYYRVLPKNSKKSANILDSLYLIYIDLQNSMTKNNTPTKEISNRLKSRFRQKSIMEVSNNNKAEGYTTDKGRIIKIKLKDPDNDGKYKDINYITYVFLHELAHIMSNSYGHNDEFNKNFKFILKLAVNKGLYVPDKANSVYICGSTNCIYK